MAKTEKSGSAHPEKKGAKKMTAADFKSKETPIRRILMGKRGLLTVGFIAMLLCMLDMFFTAGVTSIALLFLMPDGEAKSGRTGSVVYMRNGRRRNFVVPALVQNAFTTAVRNSFSTLSSAFKALDQDQIAAWNAATGFFKSNVFGQPKEVKGKALFVMLNQNLHTIGVSSIDDVPTPGAVTGLDGIVITDGADPLKVIDWTSGPVPTGISIAVFATAPLSAGISKPQKSAFRLVGVLGAGSSSPADLSVEWIAKFGTAPLGTKVFARFVPINETTGQAGAATVASQLVV